MGFWKKFAKVAIPVGAAIATPFTGGASMAALLGAGAGAASGAIDGGWKGALKGGVIGGATGGLAKGLGGKIPGLGGSSGGSYIKDAVGGVENKALGGGFWSNMLGTGKNLLTNKAGQVIEGQPGQGMADLGKVLGGVRSNEMNQRMVEGEFMQNADRLNIAASEENRNRENDALRGLAQTSYIMSGGAQPLPTRINSGALPNLGFGPTPISDVEKQGASSLQKQLLQRLTPDGQLKNTDPSTYAKPRTTENVSKWGSILTNGIGALQNFAR